MNPIRIQSYVCLFLLIMISVGCGVFDGMVNKSTKEFMATTTNEGATKEASNNTTSLLRTLNSNTPTSTAERPVDTADIPTGTVTSTPTIMVTPTGQPTVPPIPVSCSRREISEPSDFVVAFVAEWDGDREIYTIKANGTGLRQLTRNDLDDYAPHWSNNGKSIAFIRDEIGENPSRLYLMNQDGSDQRPLTPPDLSLGPDIVWSPDSQMIAFSASSADLTRRDVYVVDINSSLLSNLTYESDPRIKGGFASSWSHDGQFIAIGTWWDRYFSVWRIYTAKPDGSRLNLIESNHGRDWFAEWRPTENILVYLGKPIGKQSQIYATELDGVETQQITNNSLDIDYFQWSPDGQMINYLGTTPFIEPGSILHVMNLEYGVEGKITSQDIEILYSKQDISYSNWLPDQQHIGFVWDKSDRWDLYTINICTEETNLVIEDIEGENSPDWKP